MQQLQKEIRIVLTSSIHDVYHVYMLLFTNSEAIAKMFFRMYVL